LCQGWEGVQVIRRNLAAAAEEASRHYPIVQVMGPRQSGKTTLCRSVFAEKPYLNLEAHDTREEAVSDPRGLLRRFPEGVILDEVQNAPGLLGYLQVEVDERPQPGRFVITGSQHLGLSRKVTQSLAGRVGVLTLLPFSLGEVRRFPGKGREVWETVWCGGYPPILDRGIPPDRWLGDYVSTYLQRDVRELLNVGDLNAFNTFLRLCAGRTAQVLNLSNLGADAGVTQPTARAWLSVLEASFLITLLPAWHPKLTRQAVKAPKLHFLDSGLACHLLGIRSADQLMLHPLRGAIFESWVVAELMKALERSGRPPDLYHFRDAKGLEVDLLVDLGDRVLLVESKSGATVGSDLLAPLGRLARRMRDAGEHRPIELRLVYGGDDARRWSDVEIIPWGALKR